MRRRLCGRVVGAAEGGEQVGVLDDVRGLRQPVDHVLVAEDRAVGPAESRIGLGETVEVGHVGRVRAPTLPVQRRRLLEMTGIPGKLAELEQGEGAVIWRVGDVERTPHRVPGSLEVPVQLVVVGDPGVRRYAGLETGVPLQRAKRIVVASELDQGIELDGHRRRVEGVDVHGLRREPEGALEIVPCCCKGRLAGEGGRVVRRRLLQRAGQHTGRLGVVARIAGDAGLLHVGGAERGPRLGVRWQPLEPRLERGDRRGQVPGGGNLGRGDRSPTERLRCWLSRIA